MKTWRERIVEARGRGRFSADDFAAWRDIATCPAAEAVLACGIGDEFAPYHHEQVHGLGHRLGGLMMILDFDGFDRQLDAIDDLALELKRTRPTPEPSA